MTAQKLRATWDACCYFNEVLIFAHGEKVSYWDLQRLADMYFDLPILRLIPSMCASDRDAFPFTGHRDTFGSLCYAVRPFDECPCGCTHSDCRSFSADGVSEKCPVGAGATTTILSAGYYSSGKQDYPSKLALDPADATSPFVAPEDRLVQTTVTPIPGGAKSSHGHRRQLRAVPYLLAVMSNRHRLRLDPHPVLESIRSLSLARHWRSWDGSPERPEYEGPRWSDIDCPGADRCLQGAH